MGTYKRQESYPTKQHFQNFAKLLILFTGLTFFMSGCITLGKDFPVSNEVRKLFGAPLLSGNQDGQLAWTYGNYDYSLFGEKKAKDLVIQFDDNGVVTTYTFSTTEHNE